MQWLKSEQEHLTFVQQNMMGPNSLRIVEELATHIDLSPAKTILDLGCGAGLTSIFLAKQYNAMIYAADLWIDPSENYERFKLTNVATRIIPLRTEAHQLPFAKGYFDAVVSIDAYHYFGCENDYFDQHLAPFLKSGSTIVIAIPGLKQEFSDGVPLALQPYWQEDMHTFHSAEWWKQHMEQSEKLINVNTFNMECHEDAWEDWLQSGHKYASGDEQLLIADDGNYLATIGIIATIK